MTNYRRNFVPGGSFFFTVNLAERRLRLLTERIDRLRAAFRMARKAHPFAVDAIVILPDHLHCLWTLPQGDSQFSKRWSAVKRFFTGSFVARAGREVVRSASKKRRGERGVWQRRFWEHVIRDEGDFERHVDYIHFNPVKHGYTECPHAWAYSSFRRWVSAGAYDPTWLCVCSGHTVRTPDFSTIEKQTGE